MLIPWQAGKGGELTHDETTIISGALDLTEKVHSMFIICLLFLYVMRKHNLKATLVTGIQINLVQS